MAPASPATQPRTLRSRRPKVAIDAFQELEWELERTLTPDEDEDEGRKNFHMPRWAAPFAQPARYKCAYGGRASGKTWVFGHILIARASVERIRARVCRDYKTNTTYSAHIVLRGAIARLGLSQQWRVQNEKMVCLETGSEITFAGIEFDPEAMRGWEDLDVVWIEEAQKLSEVAARVLVPTIRKRGSELWFSWNPKNRSDWVYKRFITAPRAGDVIAKVNWRNNPWLPEASNEERIADQKDNPDHYLHIWEGAPDDAGEVPRIMPYRMVSACVEAFREGLHHGVSGPAHAGLDVGDTGYNGLALRRGPVLAHAERFSSYLLGETARRTDRFCREENVELLTYDGGGIGAGIRSHLREMRLSYIARPELFGGQVAGPRTMYSYRYANEDFFLYRNSQMAWNLRLRGQRTQQLLVGDDVDPALCLFINPAIPALDELMTQLAQPVYTETTNSKIQLNKYGEDGKEQSPDLFDAVCLAFARDSASGLRAR